MVGNPNRDSEFLARNLRNCEHIQYTEQVPCDHEVLTDRYNNVLRTRSDEPARNTPIIE